MLTTYQFKTHFARTHDMRIRVRITNHHHTVDKIGVHLKITTFSCIS